MVWEFILASEGDGVVFHGQDSVPLSSQTSPGLGFVNPSQDEWPPCAWPREVGRVGASAVFLGKTNDMKSCREVGLLGDRQKTCLRNQAQLKP